MDLYSPVGIKKRKLTIIECPLGHQVDTMVNPNLTRLDPVLRELSVE